MRLSARRLRTPSKVLLAYLSIPTPLSNPTSSTSAKNISGGSIFELAAAGSATVAAALALVVNRRLPT